MHYTYNTCLSIPAFSIKLGHQQLNAAPTRYHSDRITGLELIHQGKVRDSFAINDELMMIVASDRLSAFDVVLPDPIPGKGEILTQISNFWFQRTSSIIPNHLAGIDIATIVTDAGQLALVRKRAVIVRRLKPLPLEAIVRGYLIGSGWKDYQSSGMVSGIHVPPGLRQADRLPEILFTPSSKAPAGEHDENISFDDVAAAIGVDLANQVRAASIALYRHAVEHATQRGIIIADTKFEFGLDASGQLRVMDEMLTPDSSRFWPEESYAPGSSPPSFDKQFVRDYLETLDWNKQPPGPALPAEVIAVTAAKYQEALRRLTGPGKEGK
jgi:phosphoribosylaminoimidazole-succinocarboxamide synthase